MCVCVRVFVCVWCNEVIECRKSELNIIHKTVRRISVCIVIVCMYVRVCVCVWCNAVIVCRKSAHNIIQKAVRRVSVLIV